MAVKNYRYIHNNIFNFNNLCLSLNRKRHHKLLIKQIIIFSKQLSVKKLIFTKNIYHRHIIINKKNVGYP